MAGKNKKGPNNPCREELIVLQGVPPSDIAKQKTKKEKRAEKEQLEKMARAADEVKYGSSEAIDIPEAMWISAGKKGKKGKKGCAVEKKEVGEESDDSDSSESSDVTEVEWNFDSDFEEDNIMKKKKSTKKSKTKDNKTSKKEVKKEKAVEDKVQQQDEQNEEDGREAKKMTKKEKNKIAKAMRKAKKKAEATEKANTARKSKLSEGEITSASAKPTIPVRVNEEDTSESEIDFEIEFEPDMSISSLKPLDRVSLPIAILTHQSPINTRLTKSQTNQIHLMNLHARCNNCDTTNALLAARIEELEAQRKPLQLSLDKVEKWISYNWGDNHVAKIVKKKQKGHLGRKHKLGMFDKFVGPGAEASGDREGLQEQIRPLEDLIAAYSLEMKTGVLTCKILRYAKYVHSYGSKIITLDGLEITPESEVHPRDKARYEQVTIIFKEMQKFKAQIALLDVKDEVNEMVPKNKEIHNEDETSPSEKPGFDAMAVYMVMLTMWFLATVFVWLTG